MQSCVKYNHRLLSKLLFHCLGSQKPVALKGKHAAHVELIRAGEIKLTLRVIVFVIEKHPVVLKLL